MQEMTEEEANKKWLAFILGPIWSKPILFKARCWYLSKKKFKPYAIYHYELRLLNVYLRNCSISADPITDLHETEILLDNHPEKGMNEFVGFNLWINAEYVLSQDYTKRFGHLYPAWRFVHNKIKRTIRAQKIVLIVAKECPDFIENWGAWKEKIESTLENYPLRIHVPLN